MLFYTRRLSIWFLFILPTMVGKKELLRFGLKFNS